MNIIPIISSFIDWMLIVVDVVQVFQHKVELTHHQDWDSCGDFVSYHSGWLLKHKVLYLTLQLFYYSKVLNSCEYIGTLKKS